MDKVRVKHGFRAMATIKPIAAVGGIATLLLLAQRLPPTDYGAYFAYWALVEISLLASNLGTFHGVYRYVHATSHAGTPEISIHGPWRALTLVRLLTLIAAAGCATVILGLGLPAFDTIVTHSAMVAAVIFFEGAARHIETVFDATLEQRRTQLSTAARTIIKLLLLTTLAFSNNLSLHTVLVVEVVTSALGMFMAIRLFRGIPAANHSSNSEDGFPGWSGALIFIAPAFLAQLLGILYGPDILKLILGHNSTAAQVAAFGFCYAIASIIQRYLPATILAGMFRPVFVAAHRSGPQTLAQVFWMVWKANLLFVFCALAAIVITKDFFLQLIANGEYLAHAEVLLLLAIGMIPVSLHACLSMHCLALEKSLPTFWSTLVAASCAIFAPYATQTYGATGAAFTFVAAETTWCIACIALLAFEGKLPMATSVWRIALNTATFLTSSAVAMWLVAKGAHPIPAGGLAIAAYIVGSLKLGFFSPNEIRMVLEIIPGAARIRNWMGAA